MKRARSPIKNQVAAGLFSIGILGGLVACGVRAQGSPTALSRDQIPFDPQASTTSSTTSPSLLSDRTLSVFLVTGDGTRLVEVERSVAKGDNPNADRAVRSLIEPLSSAEKFRVYQSLLPEGTRIQATSMSATNPKTLVIDLNETFRQVAPGSQRLAVAQLVFTATRYYSVDSVSFTIDGVAIRVPDEKSLTDKPLRRDGFPALLDTLVHA